MVDFSGLSEYLSGLLSGIVSVTICAPLDLTRTRLNLNKTTSTELSGFVKTMKDIYLKHGYRGYYDGSSIV